MKKIIKTLSYLLLGIIILFILLIFINIFFFNNKYKASLVLSGSMEPDISVNDLVILKSTDKFNVNDIVSYKDTSGKVVMHRIIKIDGNKVITKGDANNVSDKEIDKSQITGIYVCNIKYLGKIIKLIKTPIGLLLILLLIVVIIFIPTGKDNLFDKKDIFICMIFLSLSGLVLLIPKNYNFKYKTKLDGSSSVQVAKFIIDTTSDSETHDFVLTNSNNSISYTFSVSNKNLRGINEVTTNYDVVITFPSLAKDVKLSLNNGTKSINGFFSDDGTVATFSNAGTFKAGVEQTDILTLNIALNSDNISTASWNNIKISVKASQVD